MSGTKKSINETANLDLEKNSNDKSAICHKDSAEPCGAATAREPESNTAAFNWVNQF